MSPSNTSLTHCPFPLSVVLTILYSAKSSNWSYSSFKTARIRRHVGIVCVPAEGARTRVIFIRPHPLRLPLVCATSIMDRSCPSPLGVLGSSTAHCVFSYFIALVTDWSRASQLLLSRQPTMAGRSALSSHPDARITQLKTFTQTNKNADEQKQGSATEFPTHVR